MSHPIALLTNQVRTNTAWHKRRPGWRAAVLLLALLLASQSAAESVTLRAVSAFPAGNRFSAPLEQLIDAVNGDQGSDMEIRYLGGGSKVLNPYELGQYVRKGLIDIAHMPSSYYKNILPEAEAIKMCYKSMSALRKNGGWEFINQLHIGRMNVYYLARAMDYIPYHLYLTRPLTSADLTGYRIRVSPVYTRFFEGMGASVLRSTPGEAYTLLERSVIDGLGWPLQGVRDFGFEQVIQYRVDPGFYRADVQILINYDRWQSLEPEQRALLQKHGLKIEGDSIAYKQSNVTEAQQQFEAGIQSITLQGADRERWMQQADALGWAEFDAIDPMIASQYRHFCGGQSSDEPLGKSAK